LSAARLPFAVLISGRGSNMLALARAARDGGIDGDIVAVISDRVDAPGLAAAKEFGLPVLAVPSAAGCDRAAYGDELTRALERRGAELVALAGFMRILDGTFVRRWDGRLLNIHPSLLPAYRGLDTHRRVLEAGETLHGCTVHFVVEELDAGPAIIQGRLRIRPGEDVASLSARVQRLEHIIYPRAAGWFAAGRLRREGAVALLDGRAAGPEIVEDRE
jgi:formyltetrahydrofolate-dependent phosphoribosylglycinamide formyltransferase